MVDPERVDSLAEAFAGPFYVELQRPFMRGDSRRNATLCALAERLGVADGRDGRRALPPSAPGAAAGRPGRDRARAARSRAPSGNGAATTRRCSARPSRAPSGFPPESVARSREIAERCSFDLTQELGYRYPDFSDGPDPAGVQLRAICEQVFAQRYADAAPQARRRALDRLETELALIDRLGLAGFFLLHWEVLELARACAVEVRGPDSARNLLPPGRGRGSSVGSLVCYLTGLSHVDPVAANLSLGRFLNDELTSVPDIDLDFPRDIRERLIVTLTERYGREHAALVASFATYRSRGAIRDLGKALGLPAGELERLARVSDGWNAEAGRRGARASARPPPRLALAGVPGAHRRDRGSAPPPLSTPRRHGDLDPSADRPCAGAARRDGRPSDLPVGQGLLRRRRVPQDRPARAGDALGDRGGGRADRTAAAEPIDLSRIPLDDPRVYAEIQHADTVGLFQIESRAQMQSLLRTRPENLEDLTVQVALVRPGPIQGKAVHPYIERRQSGAKTPTYVYPVEHESLREPLAETLGVVVFQDQVLEVAMASAGFSVGEAEGLRRAMSRKRSEAAIEAFRPRFVAGCEANGIATATAHVIYDKLVGFSGFGFPKSHAAAFALLAYQSAWVRCYYPAEFLCALLNAQPMGFYPPASLVRDAHSPRRRGATSAHQPQQGRLHRRAGAVRIGLGYIRSVGEEVAEALVAGQPYSDIGDLARRGPSARGALEALVAAGACEEWGARRMLLWRLGLVVPGENVAGGRQLALPLEPSSEEPGCGRRPTGSRCSPTTDTPRCRSAAPARAAARPPARGVCGE